MHCGVPARPHGSKRVCGISPSAPATATLGKPGIDLPDVGPWPDPPEDDSEQLPPAAGALTRASGCEFGFQVSRGDFHAGS
jgi:hypothetical protein